MPFYRFGEDGGGRSGRTEAAARPLQALVEEVGAVRGRGHAKHLEEGAVKKERRGQELLSAKTDEVQQGRAAATTRRLRRRAHGKKKSHSKHEDRRSTADAKQEEEGADPEVERADPEVEKRSSGRCVGAVRPIPFCSVRASRSVEAEVTCANARAAAIQHAI